MDMIQAEFERILGDGRQIQKLVWVDASFNLKVDNVVEFVDDPFLWKVKKVYRIRIEASTLIRKWGLDLPKSQRTER
jgi:hypothetical protein